MNVAAQALLCAKASAAAYGTDTDSDGNASCKATMKQLGFEHFVPFDIRTSFQDFWAFVASSDEYNLLTFRGTKTPNDWITDVDSKPTPFESVFPGAPIVGEIHSGFGRCLAEAYQCITLLLSHANQAKPLLITGHSLGGALAALTGVCFSVFRSPVPPVAAIYTFGQPRVGLKAFCDYSSNCFAGKLVRFVNKNDIVPRVPLRVWNYCDSGRLIHFDSTGKPKRESAEWNNFLTRAFQCFADLEEFMFNLRTDIGNHSIHQYLALVEQSQIELAPLLRQE